VWLRRQRRFKAGIVRDGLIGVLNDEWERKWNHDVSNGGTDHVNMRVCSLSDFCLQLSGNQRGLRGRCAPPRRRQKLLQVPHDILYSCVPYHEIRHEIRHEGSHGDLEVGVLPGSVSRGDEGAQTLGLSWCYRTSSLASGPRRKYSSCIEEYITTCTCPIPSCFGRDTTLRILCHQIYLDLVT
jgi:hypothetical protein